MGIFDRLSTVLKSNINDLISSAEDPEKMLNQIIADMRDQLAKAKQHVATAIADEKRLRDQANGELRLARDWEQKAMLAVQQGRDDLAKQALVRQVEHYEHANGLEATWQAHQAETEKLRNSLRELNDKIEEAKRKKNLLIARQRRAQAQKRIADTMSSLSEKSAFDAFARMEERIEQSERQIRASMEIDQEFSGDKLSQDFRQLERGASAMTADAQLLALKQKMGILPAGSSAADRQLSGGSSTPRQLNAGERAAQGAPEHEEELAELEELPEQSGDT